MSVDIVNCPGVGSRYIMGTLGHRIIYVLGRVERNSARFHHTTQDSTLKHTNFFLELSINICRQWLTVEPKLWKVKL